MFKLLPSCKDYLWGGNKLKTEFGKKYDGDVLAETWELSCHPDGPSYIVGGAYDGKTLEEYLDAEGKKVLGTNCEKFDNFPVLIKFIDAKGNLSIQVHPSDEYALKNENQYGKTEMWYVVDCEEGASLYFGFAKEISQEEFAQRIHDNTLLEVLNKVPVKKGDVFFIESGTLHAIGEGILIAEIQQNSNVTYRVYDYGRVGADGKPRQLHVEQAIKVTNREVSAPKSYAPHLGRCKYFNVDKVVLDGKCMQKISGNIDETSFLHILVLDGDATIENGGETITVKKGDSVFLPADAGAYMVQGELEALFTTIPEEQ